MTDELGDDPSVLRIFGCERDAPNDSVEFSRIISGKDTIIDLWACVCPINHGSKLKFQIFGRTSTSVGTAMADAVITDIVLEQTCNPTLVTNPGEVIPGSTTHAMRRRGTGTRPYLCPYRTFGKKPVHRVEECLKAIKLSEDCVKQ